MLFIRVFRVALYPRPEGRGFTASLKINRDIGEQVPFVNLVKSAKTFAKSPEYEANPQYSLSRNKIVSEYNSIAKSHELQKLTQVKYSELTDIHSLVDSLAQINLVGIGLENEPEPVKTKTPKLEQKPRKIYDDSFITPTIDIELPSTNGKKVIPAGGMFAIDL